MQDPTCAMKICGGINGDFSTITLGARNCAAWRHECGDMAYPIGSQFASAPDDWSESRFVSAAVAVQRTFAIDGQPGRDN